MSAASPTEGLHLDIAEDRGQLIESVKRRLTGQVGGMSEYSARAAAAVMVEMFAGDLVDGQSYRYLRDAIIKTMPDPDDWDHDAAEDSVLADYVRHLATATHGECFACGRDIGAGEKFDDARPTGGPGRRAIPICSDCA